MCKSICRDTVPKDLIVADPVSSLGAGIAGISLNGVDIPMGKQKPSVDELYFAGEYIEYYE